MFVLIKHHGHSEVGIPNFFFKPSVSLRFDMD